jgi:hypothetical protein
MIRIVCCCACAAPANVIAAAAMAATATDLNLMFIVRSPSLWPFGLPLVIIEFSCRRQSATAL